jgi:hypothetical protein
MRLTSEALAGALACIALSSGCSKPAENPARHDADIAKSNGVDPGAVAAVTRLVQADLDAIPAAIASCLSGLAAAGQTTSDQLTINFGGESVPIDWWLWQKGLIEFRGLNASEQPLLGISSRGLTLISRPQNWFTVVATPDPSSTCQAADSVTSVKCTVKIVYGVGIKPDAVTLTGKAAPIPMTVNDTVTSDGRTWTADAVDYGPAGSPAPGVLTLILGPPGDRDAARQQYAGAIAAKALGSAPAS